MKILLLLLISSAYAGTCTSITRSNYTFGQTLSSSSLNTQLNDAFGAINSFDGGCTASGTTELDSLNTTEFAVMLNAIQQGCSVSYSSANTVVISRCFASVNGAFVNKTTTTSATFGCTNCSADSASTTYYVYIATGSSGTTITPLILTTAPNADGYDSSGNKVLARFYNNASSAIDQYSIDQWVTNRFVPTDTTDISYTPTCSWSANVTLAGKYKRIGGFMYLQFEVATSGAPTSAGLTCNLPTGYLIDSARLVDVGFQTPLGLSVLTDAGNNFFSGIMTYNDTDTLTFSAYNASGTYLITQTVTQALPFTFGNGDAVIGYAIIPIVGWVD